MLEYDLHRQHAQDLRTELAAIRRARRSRRGAARGDGEPERPGPRRDPHTRDGGAGDGGS